MFQLINRLDYIYGYPGSLDCLLADMHAWDFPHEPKPRVILAFDLSFGEDTQRILDVLRRRGHRISGTEILVHYQKGSNPYIGTEAAHLDEEIREVARSHCSTNREVISKDRIKPIFGLAPDHC